MALIENKCPVCDKAGLNDFRKEKVICPQCNSDLTAYMLLNRIKIDTKETGRKMFFFLIAILVLIEGVTFIKLWETKKMEISQLAELKLYRDSLKTLNTLQSITSQPRYDDSKSGNDKYAYFKYTVRGGDFTIKLAQLFYGDRQKYKQIEKDNNLTEPYYLHKGDILKIRVNQ